MNMRIWMVGIGLGCALSLGLGCGGSQSVELDVGETSGETSGEISEDPGTTCQPSTCAELNATCGSIDDGCGTSIDCGTCEGTDGQCLDNQCSCIPDCDGKDCGFDGCSGFCGAHQGGCPDPLELCFQGVCTCQPDCAGKECGTDSCGGSCGDCTDGLNCNDGECAPEACDANCNNKDCGSNGCDGVCGAHLGGCPSPQDICFQGVCTCQPACDGKDCGSDGCGDSCGSCPDGKPNCTNNLCEEEPCIPACEGKDCGYDGCDGYCGLTGGCAGPQEVCLPSFTEPGGWCICIPACGGKNCGPDGCGGNCGTDGTCDALAGDYICTDGVCSCTPDTCNGMNYECGALDDGCGNTLDCGTCAFTVGSVGCTNGQCDCPDACASLECGDEIPGVFSYHCNGKCGRCDGEDAFPFNGVVCSGNPGSGTPGACGCLLGDTPIDVCENRDCGSWNCGGFGGSNQEVDCGSCEPGFVCEDYGKCEPWP